MFILHGIIIYTCVCHSVPTKKKFKLGYVYCDVTSSCGVIEYNNI